MTREDKLYSMRMQELAKVAEKLGIKIDKKAAKSKAIEKILEAEGNISEPIEPIEPIEPMESIEEIVGQDSLEQQALDEKYFNKNNVKQIEFNGKSMNLNQWAKELNISHQTLYARLYISKWSVEKAFTQKIRKKSNENVSE